MIASILLPLLSVAQAAVPPEPPAPPVIYIPPPLPPSQPSPPVLPPAMNYDPTPATQVAPPAAEARHAHKPHEEKCETIRGGRLVPIPCSQQ
jgi:hypothetical protein